MAIFLGVYLIFRHTRISLRISIPLSKWVITPVLNGIFVGLIHFFDWGYNITGTLCQTSFFQRVTCWDHDGFLRLGRRAAVMFSSSVSMGQIVGPSFSGWWFQTFFIFQNIWDNPSHWLICFKMVKTTNQFCLWMLRKVGKLLERIMDYPIIMVSFRKSNRFTFGYPTFWWKPPHILPCSPMTWSSRAQIRVNPESLPPKVHWL